MKRREIQKIKEKLEEIESKIIPNETRHIKKQ